MIRKLFVPIRGDGKGENVLRHAAAIARRFNAHIEAVHCRPRAADLLPFGVPIPGFLKEEMARQQSSLADLEEQKLKAEFHALTAEIGVPVVDAPSPGVFSASWHEEEGKQVDVVKRRGRLCDVLVVAKPDRSRNLGANTLKTALFNAGRPVLMCPPTETPPAELGRHVAIAWNGSLEATRAVAMCPTLIGAADKVSILAIDDDPAQAANADALLAYLGLRGLSLTIHRAASNGSAGAALLEETDKLGADLLIMGAYGDSHERETFFGGNTQLVVDRAAAPVVLVH